MCKSGHQIIPGPESDLILEHDLAVYNRDWEFFVVFYIGCEGEIPVPLDRNTQRLFERFTAGKYSNKFARKNTPLYEAQGIHP